MMSDNGVWFKLWIGADEDPDLGDLSLDDFARWCKFGLYLKKYGTDGTIELKNPCLALQHKFKVASFDDVLKCIRKFPNCNVTCVTNATVTWENWAKYQGDSSIGRVRRFRQRVTLEEEKRRDKKRRDKKRGESTPSDDVPVDLIFETFWKAYPRKTKKQEAYKAWCKEAKLCADIQTAIFAALDWQVKQPQWNRDGGQYIPHPASWLNGKRWQDEKLEVNNGKSTSEPKGYESLRQFRAIRDGVR